MLVDATPRSWLDASDRSSFGRGGDRRWRQATNAEELVCKSAAQVQHGVVSASRARLEELDMSVGDLAGRLADEVPSVRTKPDMLRRKFRGEARASVDDLVAWLIVLEVDHGWSRLFAEELEGVGVGVTGRPYDRRRDDHHRRSRHDKPKNRGGGS